MRRPDAQQIARERAMRSEQIVVVPHAIARMHERGLDFLDVQRCLRRGRVTRGPYNPPDSATGELRYDIEAFVDEDCLRVVVELPERSMDVIVVTVFVVE